MPADVIDAARAEHVHLLIADRFRVAALASELRRAGVIEALRARELRAVLASLARAGVDAILLKGAALGYTHYARPELRPRLDTDIMIPSRARETAAAALVALGYQRPSEIDGDIAIGQFHVQRTDPHGVEHALDVHWRISNVRAFADAVTYDELASQAVRLPALGGEAFGPSSVHALLIACIHRVAHHGDTGDLLWLLDVQLLAIGLSSEERKEFSSLATAKRMRAVCARSLGLAQQVFGGLDSGWLESLSSPADDHATEPSAAFIGGGLRPVDILASDLAETEWRSRAQLLREHLFPSASYMRARFSRWPAVLLPIAYAVRIVTGAPRWLRR